MKTRPGIAGGFAIGNNYNLTAYEWPKTALFEPRRFDAPDLDIGIEPSFSILPSDRIFVIGSCFAREIRDALNDRGLSADDAGLGNKYNNFTTLHAIEWATGGGFDERLIVKLDDGAWFDGHRHPFIHHQGREEAAGIHLELLAQTRAALRACDVVVITLGLVEVWRDDQTGTWLNGTPPRHLIAGFDDRFSVHRTTHAENLQALSSIFEILHKVNSHIKIVCTVSPVPLRATFFGPDVLVANAYSKATLRSVATEAVETARRRHALAVDLFPSFELATLCPRERVWRDRHPTGEPDGRHVRPEFVREVIVPLFVKHYLPQAGV